MLKSRSDMDIVSNRWESIRSLFRNYIPFGARDIQVQSFNYLTSSYLKWCQCSQILAFLISLKWKPFSKYLKPLPLITDLPKPAWLWKWFRNNWLRMVVAGCGLYYFISARFSSFWIVVNFSTIDRCVFQTYGNSYNGA